MSRLLAVAAVAVAPACAYVPDSFSSRQASFAGVRTTVGCLDVAVALAAGPPQDGPIVRYSVGNRCDRAAVVDFSAIHVRSASGVGFGPELDVYDPALELRPLRMEARTAITELIEYRHTVPPLGGELCVDVGGMNGPAHDARWVCQGGGAS